MVRELDNKLQFLLQTVSQSYKNGVNWAETSAPLVWERLGPYFSTAHHWALEALEKVKGAKVAALEKLEEARPGSRRQLEQLGVEAGKLSEAAIFRVQALCLQAQDTTLQIIK